MQTIGLPRHVTRGAALASCLCAKERSDAAHRHDALDRWRQARADGLTAQAAANAVGVSRATLYRRRKLRDRGRLAPHVVFEGGGTSGYVGSFLAGKQ